jgi:hypothetical protein
MAPVCTLEQPTELLFVSQDHFRSGVSRAVDGVERDGVSVCRSHRCPNAYLGIETVKGPREIWYPTPAVSQVEMDGFGRVYAENKTLADALAVVVARRKPFLARATVTHLMRRAHQSGGANGWNAGCGRYLVIATRIRSRRAGQADFVEDEGATYSIIGVRTLKEAQALVKAAGATARAFRVRADFSIPAAAWVKADRSFWRAYAGETNLPR